MFEIVKSLLSTNEIKKLEETLIITVAEGYQLFGEFLISKIDNRYRVTKYNTGLEAYFYNLQNATIFVILYKRNKVVELKRMLELDVLLESANADLIRYKNRGTDLDSKIISYTKFEEARHRKYVVSKEILEFSQDAKTWQETRFKEAIK